MILVVTNPESASTFGNFSESLPAEIKLIEAPAAHIQKMLSKLIGAVNKQLPMQSLVDETTVLFRPVGQQELDLIRDSAYAAFPQRLAEQPLFYPVLNEDYATQIARDWNARYNTPKVGYVTRFQVCSQYIAQFEVHTVGAAIHQEYWIPAESLSEFNQNIVGKIEVIGEFRP